MILTVNIITDIILKQITCYSVFKKRKEMSAWVYFFYPRPTLLVYLAKTSEEESPIESGCPQNIYFPS